MAIFNHPDTLHVAEDASFPKHPGLTSSTMERIVKINQSPPGIFLFRKVGESPIADLGLNHRDSVSAPINS